MYFELKSRVDYASTNEEFKNITLHLLDFIFNPNKIVFEYLKSTPNNFSNQRQHVLDPRDVERFSEIKKIKLVSLDIKETESNIGVFEECLKNHIISQDYAVLILTGASGSGKTSVINSIIEDLKICENDNTCIRYDICKRKKKEILYYNFLNTDNDEDSKKVLEAYNFNINKLLNQAVTSCFKHENITREFLLQLSDENNYQLKLILNPIKSKWTIESVLTKIRQSGESNENQNQILTSMLEYFRNKFPKYHKGCFTIIYDNIDRLDDNAQTEIIKKIITLHNTINCKLVITSRLTTFYKLNDNFSNIISVIENAGPKPTDIIRFRIKYYLENKNILHDIIDLRDRAIKLDKSQSDKSYIDYFDNILFEIKTYLDPLDDIGEEKNEEVILMNSKKNRVQKTIEAFAGLSVRRGLEISKRMVHSYVYNYNNLPTSNQLIASLSYCNSRGIDFRDKYITNIFARYDDNGRNSWLFYKILNILDLSHRNKMSITVGQLADLLKLYGDIEEKTIINAINNLIKSHKRLAFISGYSQIEKLDEDSYTSQQIHITNAGDGYFNFLSTDLIYIQNCFAAIDWKPICFFIDDDENEINLMFSNIDTRYLHISEANWILNELKGHCKIPIHKNIPKVFNVNNIYERMQFVRISLEILMYHDVFESYYFKRNVKRGDKELLKNIVSFIQLSDEINSFPSLKLILATANAFSRILKSYQKDNSKLTNDTIEIEKWISLIQKANLWNKSIFCFSTSYGDTIIMELNDFINTERNKASSEET